MFESGSQFTRKMEMNSLESVLKRIRSCLVHMLSPDMLVITITGMAHEVCSQDFA